MVKLGSILRLTKGKKPVHQSDSAQDGYLPYVDIKAFETGRINAFTDGEKCLPCKTGDVLIVCDGARSGLVGRAIAGYVGSTLAKVTAEGLNNDYLFYFIQGKYALLNTKMKGTGTPHLNVEDLKKQKLVIPEKEEQERIVAKIEELFSEIDKIEETILRTSKQLIQYKQAVLKHAFSTIEHGNLSTLGEVLQNKPRNGFSPKAVAHETPYKNLTLTSTTGGVFRDGFYKYIELDIDKDSYLWVKRNDILIQRANTIDYVGTAALYTGEDNQYVYPDLMMKCRTKAGVLPSFIVYQLQSQNCKIHFRKHATGTSGSMPKINQQTVISTPIVIADIHIQEKVVQHIEQQLSAYTNIELTIQRTQEQLKSLRRSILKQAFEGNLV